MKNLDSYTPNPAENFSNRNQRFENEYCTVEYIVTTQKIVDRLLDGNLKNRKINDNHMKKLSMDIRNGRWVFNGQPVIRDKDGYLRDGQHRLLAIKNAGYPQVPILLVTLKGDKDRIELAYDRMDMNKTRTYGQRLAHKGIEYFNTVASIRRKITYIKTAFCSFPVVSDSVYDEIGKIYRDEIEKIAPLVGKGFTADMAAAVCLIGRATGCLDECVQIIRRAKNMEGLQRGTTEFTLMKVFNKTIDRKPGRKSQGRNAFAFAAVANGLIASLNNKKYPVVDTDAHKAAKWIIDMAKENQVFLLPGLMRDVEGDQEVK